MNTEYRKSLPGAGLDYFDARAAVEDVAPGTYDKLPYTSRVLAENLVRRCDPARLQDSLRQIIERRRDLDFPWYPARVVCHDILGQTALVDLAGLRDAIAEQGGDPAKVKPRLFTDPDVFAGRTGQGFLIGPDGRLTGREGHESATEEVAALLAADGGGPLGSAGP